MVPEIVVKVLLPAIKVVWNSSSCPIKTYNLIKWKI